MSEADLLWSQHSDDPSRTAPAAADAATEAEPEINMESEPDFLNDLDEAQRQAVLHDDGPLVVLAGPGAGKTRVIVHRLARLLAPREQGGAGAEPESILAIAFTINSAEEMRERLAELIDPRIARRVRLSTAHAYGRSLVRRFGDMLPLGAEDHIMDTAQRKRMLRELMIEHGIFDNRRAEGRDRLIPEITTFIKDCANADVLPDDAVAWLDRERQRIASVADPVEAEGEQALVERYAQLVKCFQVYEERRLSDGALTLDDYIALPLRILRGNTAVASIIRSEIKHVVVDEFQDWNPAQIELLAALAPGGGSSSPDMCIVGDDDQAIYGFRGADVRAFQRFASHYPSHKTLRLTRNYRSAPVIINASNAIIAKIDDRFAEDKQSEPDPDRIAPTCESPESVEAYALDDWRSQGSLIAALILADQAKTKRPFSEYAVLVRSNSDLVGVADALDLSGIPFSAIDRASILEEPAVRRLLNWIALLASPRENVWAQQLLTAPPFSIPADRVSLWRGEHLRAASDGSQLSFLDWLSEHHSQDRAVSDFVQTVERLRQCAAQETADRVAERIIHEACLVEGDAPKARARSQRVRSLIKALRFIRGRIDALEPPADIAAFHRHYQDLDKGEQGFDFINEDRTDVDPNKKGDEEGVRVLTAHGAKGLQFDTVFVARVMPGHGFPKTQGGIDKDPLPESLSGQLPVDRLDEERRVFYVAITRAKRRLVLVGKKRKNPSKSTCFFDELTLAAPQLEAPVIDGDAIIESSPLLAGGSSLAETLIENGERLERVIEGARRQAAATIRRAEAEDALDADNLDALVDSAGDALRTIVIASALKRGREPEPALMPAGFSGEVVQRMIERYAREEAPIVGPQPPPFSLSYSKISDFLRCPRCYAVKNILKLDEPKTPALVVGSVVHKALEEFYNKYRLADSEGRAAPDLNHLLQLGQLQLRRQTPRHIPIDPSTEDQLEGLLTAAHNELREENLHVIEVERSVQFPYEHNGVEHSFIAKIDRVDMLPDGRQRLVDYKTGSASKKLKTPPKKDLQLCIYLMALMHEQDLDAPPEGIAEYHILSTGERGAIDFDALDLAGARQEINGVIDALLAGRFEPGDPSKCKKLCALLGSAI